MRFTLRVRILAMKPDLERFLPLLDEPDMTREEKEEAIGFIWKIIEHVMTQAFSKHPVQKILSEREKTALATEQMPLDSKNPYITDRFNQRGQKRLQ